jgi:DNA polymerase-3 subunit epsilon
MNSVELCQYWLKNGALFLDTETTGVDDSAEIIEIAVINNEGRPVYESLIRPRVPITPELTALHGISNEMVAEAPQFWEVYNGLCQKLEGKLIIAYGADFDARMIRQTCELYNLKDLSCRWGCAMQMYQDHIGQEKRIKLADAAEQCRVSPLGKAHRARVDAETMLQIVSVVATTNYDESDILNECFFVDEKHTQ